MKTLWNHKKYGGMIAEISDERGNGDGVWVYLKKPFADFYHDHQHPTRQLHEQTVKQLLSRLKGVRTVTEADLAKFPHLN